MIDHTRQGAITKAMLHYSIRLQLKKKEVSMRCLHATLGICAKIPDYQANQQCLLATTANPVTSLSIAHEIVEA